MQPLLSNLLLEGFIAASDHPVPSRRDSHRPVMPSQPAQEPGETSNRPKPRRLASLVPSCDLKTDPGPSDPAAPVSWVSVSGMPFCYLLPLTSAGDRGRLRHLHGGTRRDHRPPVDPLQERPAEKARQKINLSPICSNEINRLRPR